MNPDPEHQKRLKKAAEMMVENQLKMIRMIMIKAAMGIIEGSMEAIEEAEQKPAKKPWVSLTEDEVLEEEEFIAHKHGHPVNHETAILMEFVGRLDAKLKEKNHG